MISTKNEKYILLGKLYKCYKSFVNELDKYESSDKKIDDNIIQQIQSLYKTQLGSDDIFWKDVYNFLLTDKIN